MKRLLISLSLVAFMAMTFGVGPVFAATAEECTAAIQKAQAKLDTVQDQEQRAKVTEALDKAKENQTDGDFDGCVEEATEAAEMME